MKILYGIQGTGNGHISRARILARHLEKTDIDVTYLFSGRERKDFFDMEIFGDFLCLRGFTFYSTNGAVSYKKTLLNNNIFHFLSDLISLDLTDYDLIITDFEPISAWAGKLRNKKVIGLGHQYAFNHNIPRAGDNALTRSIMRYFSPATISIGLHWNHFGNQEVLPPIIDTEHILPTNESIDSKSGKKNILVYLPFENPDVVQKILKNFTDYYFTVYAPQNTNQDINHIALRKTCLNGFKSDLASSDGVICNSGFELISECLHLGLPILTKPQSGQMEQQSNAAALQQLNYALTMKALDADIIQQWLDNIDNATPSMVLPDVAKYIVEWLLAGQTESIEQLGSDLWEKVSYRKV